MTSGNGSNVPKVTVSIPQDGKSKEPRPKVKPHVLTHLIGGFVIQEGARPFPVERPSFAIDSLTRPSCQLERGSLKMASEMEDLSALELKAKQDSMLTCELCGRVDFAHIFKGSKRFCSTLCAKRYNVGCTRRMGLFPNRKTTVDNLKKQKGINRNHKCSAFESKNKKPVSMQKPATGSLSSGNSTCPAQEQSSRCSRASSYDAAIHDPPDLYPFLSQSFLPSDPGKWNVENVYRFIRSLPGCAEIAEEFSSQEIDGQALLLLKEDHLMGTMNIKLGPALKIFAQISVLKES